MCFNFYSTIAFTSVVMYYLSIGTLKAIHVFKNYDSDTESFDIPLIFYIHTSIFILSITFVFVTGSLFVDQI